MIQSQSAGYSATRHWWHQRLTSVIMVPLVMWLIYFLHSISGYNIADALIILRKSYNIIPMMILVVISFYHASLGMEVVIEDYIKNLTLRYFLIISLEIFTAITVLSALVALLFLILV